MDESVEKKLLAEWFWIDRWDGSSAVLLTMEAQGVYRAMLSQAWRRGAQLPADLDAVQRLIRCTAGEWSRSWPLVKRYWRREDAALVNKTQQEVYAIALAAAVAASEKGRNAARKRWGQDAQAMPGDVHGQCPPSPSPYPSLTPNERTPPIPPADRGGAAPKASTRASADTTSIEQHLEQVLKHVKAGGGLAFRKSRRRLREWLRAGMTVDEVKAAVDRGEHLDRLPL